jgi:hypothetical protein
VQRSPRHDLRCVVAAADGEDRHPGIEGMDRLVLVVEGIGESRQDAEQVVSGGGCVAVGGRVHPDADLVADPGVGYPRLGHLPGSRFFVGGQLGYVHHTQPVLLREMLHLPRDVHKGAPVVEDQVAGGCDATGLVDLLLGRLWMMISRPAGLGSLFSRPLALCPFAPYPRYSVVLP